MQALAPASVLLAATEGGKDPNPLLPHGADLFWGSVCFAILLLLFWRYILPQASAAMAARTAGIEGKLEQAERDRVEAHELLAQYRQQLAEARTEAATIRTQAQSDRAAMIEEARAEAIAAAEAVTARAQVALEADRIQARSELSREIGGLSIELASRVVGESLTDDERARRSVDRFLADLEAMAAAGPSGSGTAAPAGGQD